MAATEAPVDLIIYRINDKGLEVFLLENGQNARTNFGTFSEKDTIELEPYTASDGTEHRAIAIEADWHDIPSLRALVYEDYVVAKQKAKAKIKDIIHEIDPQLELDKGAYVAVKDAVKRALPGQYHFLKELKDIVFEKNSTRYV